jgi:hypothetical protein
MYNMGSAKLQYIPIQPSAMEGLGCNSQPYLEVMEKEKLPNISIFLNNLCNAKST